MKAAAFAFGEKMPHIHREVVEAVLRVGGPIAEAPVAPLTARKPIHGDRDGFGCLFLDFSDSLKLHFTDISEFCQGSVSAAVHLYMPTHCLSLKKNSLKQVHGRT